MSLHRGDGRHHNIFRWLGADVASYYANSRIQGYDCERQIAMGYSMFEY